MGTQINYDRLISDINDELLILCKKHGDNDKCYMWLYVVPLSVIIGFIVAILEAYLLNDFFVLDYGIKSALFCTIVLVIDILLFIPVNYIRNKLNRAIYQKCNQLQRVGFFVVRQYAGVLFCNYPYTFYLKGEEKIDYDADTIGGDVVDLKNILFPNGISELLS